MFIVTMGINAGHCFVLPSLQDCLLLPWALILDIVLCFHEQHCRTMFSVTMGIMLYCFMLLWAQFSVTMNINAGHCLALP